MGNNKSELVVAAIENGTVIDHIPAEKTYQVVNLLQLEKMDTPVTIGYNLPSKKIGKKGIIKVANKYFTDEEINRLSVVAPNIGLSIIKDYEIVEKKTVKTPDTLKGIVKSQTPEYFLRSAPGTAYEYANLNGGLLGSLIERLSGQSLNSFMAEQVFSPLGINAAYAATLLPDPSALSATFRTDGSLYISAESYLEDDAAYDDSCNPDAHYRAAAK